MFEACALKSLRRCLWRAHNVEAFNTYWNDVCHYAMVTRRKNDALPPKLIRCNRLLAPWASHGQPWPAMASPLAREGAAKVHDGSVNIHIVLPLA